MKKIRLAALFMAMLMLALCFVSCANTPEEGGENSTAANETQGPADPAATTLPEETTYPVDENGYELDRLPELNYNDEEFVIFTWSNQVMWEWNEDGETTGDKIHDAIYNRQVRTEERLGIKIVISKQNGDWDHRNSFITAVEANVESGNQDAFDLVGQYTPAAPIGAMKNLYTNLSDAEYLDWERPWWPQDIQESCHINNNVYFITGDITGTLVRNIHCIIGNLDLANNHNLPNLYELVENKEWTMAKFAELSLGTIQGINPDGTACYSVTFPNNVEYDSLFYGAGFRFVDHDADGNLVMSEELDSDRLETWYQTCQSFLLDNADVEILAINGTNGFTSGNVLFHCGGISDVQNSLQDVNFDFAVLPFPLYDENQEEYYTITSYWVSMYSIPTNAPDPAKSAAVLECLSSYGYRYITPVIYQEAFQYRYLDTLENATMFDLLHNTLVFDPGRLFADQLNCFAAFRQAAQTAYTSWNSYYAKNSKLWGRSLENIISTLG
ncbi:MAG: extracellular solute-binding protein [Clostridia bacterium]|nr:extracellular solute-binding protein [Clostridia bacterium]